MPSHCRRAAVLHQHQLTRAPRCRGPGGTAGLLAEDWGC
jgi:hypothetical protein